MTNIQHLFDEISKVKEAAYHDGYTMGQRNANEGRVTASQLQDAELRGRSSGLWLAQVAIDNLRKENAQLRRVHDLTLKEVASTNERINTAYENGVVSGRAQAMTTEASRNAVQPEFQVGDVWRRFVEGVNTLDRMIRDNQIPLRHDPNLPPPGPTVPQFEFFGWKVFRR